MTTHPSIDLDTSIDLNFCVPGQKVRLRSGGIADYLGLIENNISLVYLHQLSSGKYVSNGCYWSDQRTDELDVVEILPLKSTMTIETGIDLSTCVRGQKVKLRDGTIATYDGVIDENEIYIHAVGGHSYTKRGTFWMEDGHTSPKDVVEILPIEEEPAKPTPGLTHSIIDQIDVANPDHVSIIPHEHGVTISIKKGLTTISWRHDNH
jgi:hypothetical protein